MVFLGSSLGNYSPEEAVALLAQVARIMRPEDRLLLGTDLAKDRATLEAAYDDAQGVTAQFNGNLLRRINRELGADFDLDQFRHHAVYRPELGRVEMHLIARSDQVVRIPSADLTVRFEAGESIHTESPTKGDGGRPLATWAEQVSASPKSRSGSIAMAASAFSAGGFAIVPRYRRFGSFQRRDATPELSRSARVGTTYLRAGLAQNGVPQSFFK